MRILHALMNLIALGVLAGVPALYLYLCRGAVTCAEQAPVTLVVAFGAIPVFSYLAAALVSLLNWKRSLSRRVVLAAALLGAVATYTAVAAALLMFERVMRPSSEDGVPILLAAGSLLLLWVPLTALWNAGLLVRAVNASSPRDSTHVA